MCGIAGYIGSSPPLDRALSRALESMRRRGPDHQDFRRIALRPGIEATLLSSRLAIVDLDPRSNMPFRKGDWTITFNGEVYNHAALRRELEAENISFSTDSDTEVLIAGLAHYGIPFLDRAEGMWAFAAVNERTREAILCRDRFGEKPLFVHESSHGVYFASEPKAIAALAEQNFPVNERHLLRYLVNGYRALHKTSEGWFEGIKNFPAGTVRSISAEGIVTDRRYWNIPSQKREIGEAEAIEHLRVLLPEAIRLRLRADVPIACCLSGGIDSSTIASLAVKTLGASLHTFSIIDSNPHYDERAGIEAVTRDLGCKATFIEVPQAPFLERLSDLIRYHEGPLATSSYYIHSFLSEAIAGAGYRVALSGTGSDELFTGYYDHYLLHLAEIGEGPAFEAARTDWMQHVNPHIRNPLLKDPHRFIREPGVRDHLYIRNPELLKALRVPFDEAFQEVDFGRGVLRNRMLNELFFEVVPPILREDDMNSMRWSVENRSPFLDRRLFEFCTSLPTSDLISDGYQKSLLRKAMQGVLADPIRLNRKKIGFNASMSSLLRRDDPSVRATLLERNPLDELVDPMMLRTLLDKSELTNQESQLLFSLVNASLFLRQVI